MVQCIFCIFFQVYKRFTFVVIVCTVTVTFFKITFIPLKLKMPNQNDFKNHKWSDLQIHTVKGQTSTAQANTLDKNFSKTVNTSRSTLRQGLTQTTPMAKRYDSTHIQTLDNELNYSLDTVTGDTDNAVIKYNVTKHTHLKSSETISTMKAKTVLQHTNESDQKKLAQNKYKIKDLMSVVRMSFSSILSPLYLWNGSYARHWKTSCMYLFKGLEPLAEV